MNIYYCWFGGKPLTDEIKKMIATWEQFFPNNRIVEINEKNFDVASYPYAKSAYEAKKYAFVSDCARAHFLYHYGGYYFDTDVEVKKEFSTLFFENDFTFSSQHPHLIMSMEYFSFEITGVSTAVILSSAKHTLLKDLLDDYAEKEFIDDLEPETINQKMNKLLVKKSEFQYKDKKQKLNYDDDFITLVPANLLMLDKPTAYAVHHLDGSWKNSLSFTRKVRRFFGIMIKKIIGRERFERLWGK